MKRWVAAGLGLALAVGSVMADEVRSQVEQRIRLAAALFADSPAAQRITRSGNAEAVALLDQGRLHHAMAEEALRRGDMAEARREIDEALRHVGAARRLVPDSAVRQAAAKQRHEELMASLERLVEAWRVQDGAAAPQDGDLASAESLMSTARSLGAAGRHVEALAALKTAERQVITGMNRSLQQREINYTQRAGTPEQEFQLELRRHQAMADLLPVAVGELRPQASAVQLIERYAETSRTLRAQAEQKAQAGDITEALALVRKAMLNLQRAMQAAGLSMPQSTETTQ